MTRGTLYVLLPICLVAGLFLMAQGVPQTLGASVDATTLEGAQQTIARGPVATQEAIKLLSGDGGGFFNVNSAHPFENPTPPTNLVEVLLIFVLGAALTNCFGRMVESERQGWVLLSAMAILFAARSSAVSTRWKPAAIPRFTALAGQGDAEPTTTVRQYGRQGNALWRRRLGAVRRRCHRLLRRRRQRTHDSFLPLSGGMLLANMMVDEVIVGAPGSGLFGMLLFASSPSSSPG